MTSGGGSARDFRMNTTSEAETGHASHHKKYARNCGAGSISGGGSARDCGRQANRIHNTPDTAVTKNPEP